MLMHWLARTLYYQQRYTEAEEFYRKATQGQEKVLGKEHIQTFWQGTTSNDAFTISRST